jgi:hypothetical protein
LLENSGYVDENPMLPTTGFEYDLTLPEPTGLFDPSIAAQATLPDDLEVQHVQAPHTQFSELSGEFAPARTPLDQIPLDQTASTPTRYIPYILELGNYVNIIEKGNYL